MTELRQKLDRLVPETPAEGNWERVLADAEQPQRRRLGLVLPVAAAAAAIAILALAWPFGSDRTGGVLDRALAAIGEGPVLHVVYRGEFGSTLVDLSSGEVTPLVPEWEVWYDPDRGLHQRSRLGKVEHDRVLPPELVSGPQKREFVGLADSYRSALESGEARVIGDGHVAGRPVQWIRVRSTSIPDVRNGQDHVYAWEVAVDRDTYEPVYGRSTRDGRPEPGSGKTILKLERLPADADAFDPALQPDLTQGSSGGGTEFGKLLEPTEFDAAVGGSAFWLGPTFAGEKLADARELIIRTRATPSGEWKEGRGLYLYYGEFEIKDGIPQRALGTPKVVLEQFGNVPEFWINEPDATAAREGSVLISTHRSYVGGQEEEKRWGVVLRDGTYVSIQATDVRAVLEAAAALRPAGVEAVPPLNLDLASIAREVEARKGHMTEVSGPNTP